MAAGKWRPLISHVRHLWSRALSYLHGRLWTSQVYGHSNHQWNDRADTLASQNTDRRNDQNITLVVYETRALQG